MSELLESIMKSLNPATVQGMAQQLGASPQATNTAIQAALPLLLGQLSRNASQPQGAEAILGAAVKDHSNVDLGGLLGGLLGGGGQQSGGAAILGHIFGQRQPRVAQGMGQATGLDTGQSAQLLAMLAPIVMAVIGHLGKQGQLSPGGLAGALNEDERELRQSSDSSLSGMLGSLLDSDGDGKPDAGGLGKAATMLGSLFGKR